VHEPGITAPSEAVMDWRARFGNVIDNIERLPNLKWLAFAAIVAVFFLLVVLIVLSLRYIDLRRRLGAKEEPAGEGFVYSALPSWEELGPAMSLEGEGWALIDRVFPRRPRNFLFAVAGIAIGCWVLGFALTQDVYGFLTSHEWQLQPLYLAAHFVTLRLFATMFSRNFMAGVAHLDVPPSQARHGVWLVLGPVGALIALVLAVPFCLSDYRALFVSGARGGGAAAGASDYLLYGMWCMEWFLIAFIWEQLVGFLVLSRWAIRDHDFRSPIEVVLHEKQYQPLLQMSAQGATIVLGFFLVNALYTWYAQAEITDYIGVGVTLVLLVIGFIPPWMQLTAKVDGIVNREVANLRRRMAQNAELVGAGTAPAGEAQSVQDVERRLDEALVMLRIAHLERLQSELGSIEAKSIFFKVIVPVATIGYYVLKYLRVMP
jgi:hypothetical protein